VILTVLQVGSEVGSTTFFCRVIHKNISGVDSNRVIVAEIVGIWLLSDQQTVMLCDSCSVTC